MNAPPQFLRSNRTVVLPIEQDGATGRLIKSVEEPQERGLARPARSDHSHDLARLHLLAVFWACQLGGFVPVPLAADAPAGGSSPAAAMRDGIRVIGGEPWLVSAADPGASGRTDSPAVASSC